jgi:hypothetical protein
MDLQTLDISPEEAQEKLAEYQENLHGERTAEDAAIAAGYRAAARGLPVICLPDVIAAGGFFPGGLPKIAVVRADATECYAWWEQEDLVFSGSDWAINRGALVGRDTVRVHLPGHAPGMLTRRNTSWSRGSTVVPLILPRHRPRLRRLRGFHLLWEAEEWAKVPPRDPALLRHIRGDLWSVQAVWDLTELERHVLSQRA